jgi:hypothetical protein
MHAKRQELKKSGLCSYIYDLLKSESSQCYSLDGRVFVIIDVKHLSSLLAIKFALDSGSFVPINGVTNCFKKEDVRSNAFRALSFSSQKTISFTTSDSWEYRKCV